MTLFENVFVLAPASEVPCPSPVPHLFLSSPTSSCCISQISQEKRKRKGKDRTKKLSKDHIGSPHNFKHQGHIGWSPQIGFATSPAPERKMIFAHAGVTQDPLKDKRTSEKIFEITEKQGRIEAVLKEAETKGFLKRSSTPSLPSELSSACHLKNELECQTLRGENGLKHVPAAGPAFISEAQRALQGNISSVVISSVPSMSPATRKSHHNLILNLKEVQLKKEKRDNLTLSGPQVLACEIKKEAQQKPVVLSPLSPQHPSDVGIIAALKDVIKKRQKMIHVSDEESNLEKGDEWDEDVVTPQEAENRLTT